MKKIRLDALLITRSLAPSQVAAERAIRAGEVWEKTRRLEKPGMLVPHDIALTLKSSHPAYVSRGGLKLAAALDYFAIPTQNRVAMDVGAATGGFTDCLLKRGAKLVYAVDVGYGQLHSQLRSDKHVRVMERTHFLKIDPGAIDPRPSLFVMDVSFISVKKLIPQVLGLRDPHQTLDLVLLTKPQFEVARAEVGRGGIVRAPHLQQRVIEEITTALMQNGFEITGSLPSPIRGAKGNQEFLIAAGVRKMG